MFTGIIKELGTVSDIRKIRGICRLGISAKGMQHTAIGDSIAVNGVCLTTVESKADDLVFEIMPETMKKTNLGRLRKNDLVNLESPLKAGDKLSGHILSGHIDGIGSVKDIIERAESREIHVKFPVELKRYIVPKGSIAVDGVSLTVGEAGEDWFSIYIIPHTWNYTRFNSIKVNDSVNLEADLLAKYVQVGTSSKETITEEFLRKHGFLEHK